MEAEKTWREKERVGRYFGSSENNNNNNILKNRIVK